MSQSTRLNKSLALLFAAVLSPSLVFAQQIAPPPALQEIDQKRLRVEASPNNPFKKAGTDDLPPPGQISGPGGYQGALPLEVLIGTNEVEKAPQLKGMINGKPFIQFEGRFIYGQEAESLYSDAVVAKLVQDRRSRNEKLTKFIDSQKKVKASAAASSNAAAAAAANPTPQ